MIIYNVTINVDDTIHLSWLEWMRNEHIPAVLSTGLFSGYRICRLLAIEDEGATYSIQYSCNSLVEYNEYKERHAPGLQKEMAGKFKDKFTAFRTLMEVVE
ncbi:MAG TPA: DUF4286 family protein [Bacteroidia bacterium]|jgi:hypothetical protein|nr:DUF4286 family protein [Bacteroidia bacterium]